MTILNYSTLLERFTRIRGYRAMDTRDFLSSTTTRFDQVVVPAGGQTTITFAAIPATHENLTLVVYGRGTAAATAVGVLIRFNNDVGNNYNWQRGFASNGSAIISGSESVAGTSARGATIPAASMTANVPGISISDIPGYARTVFHKVVLNRSGYYTTTDPELAVEHAYSQWGNTAAITEIDLTLTSGNFAEGTVATLYLLA